MIPPVTGNGMSMAFEAAEIAIRPVAEYARGDLSWSEACRMTASACDTNFRQRLFWAKWLQAMMFSAAARGRLGALLLNSRWVWQLVFARTR
jgi:flavin-dependent dehydrogenase